MHESIIDATPPETTHQQKVLLISKYYQLASCIILLYDYILTVDLEVERVWGRALRVAGSLFCLNRYFPLFSYIWIIIDFLGFVTIVTLRLHAMYLGKRNVLVFLGALAVIQIALGAWAATQVTLLDVPPHSGCVITVKDDSYYVFGLLWAWSVVFDSTVCFMTIWKSVQNRRSNYGVKTPLLDLLVRDGVVYFVVMFAAKVVNFVVFWIVSRDLITVNWTFNHTITVIMISRLFLNARAGDSVTVFLLEQQSTTQERTDSLTPMRKDGIEISLY